MNDKTNILGSLMDPSKNMDLGQQQQQQQATGQSNRPTSGVSSSIGSNSTTLTTTTAKQHKLKQRFTVIKKLGKGTYGKVQLAINKQTGQEVAIKTIKKTKIENEQDLQRVRREIQIMSSIEHPHIIHIYEVFENKDKIVLVMQYAPGGELYEYVSQSKVLDDSEARRLFRQIATAIYYCHQNKICHRDLKLENILLDEKNNAKLADFGLSNVFNKSRYLKTFCGSPLYASPEIVQGSPYEGPEVDCWSLGVLLYTLVYGAMPFDGSNFKRLVKQISEACYFEPKQRSAASTLIRRLLCADPLKRATILDICSDPWVNGLSMNQISDSQYQRISPNNEQKQQQSNVPQNSLLQVAQDMANLTPVRFDILLALTQTSPTIKTTDASMQQDENKPPLQVKKPPTKAYAESKRPPSLDMEPSSMMEFDDEASHVASPVASYIVRDLEASDRMVEGEKEEPMQELKSELTQQVDVTEKQRTMEVELKKADVKPADVEVAEISVEPQINQEVVIEAFEEECSTMATSDEQSEGIKQESIDKEGEDHSMSSKEIFKGEKYKELGEFDKPSSNEVRMEVEEKAETEQAVKVEETIGPTIDQVHEESEVQKDKQDPSEICGKDATVASGPNEDIKQKKVKKKIVVKKRKKVAKKDTEVTATDGTKQEFSSTEQDDKTNEQQLDKQNVRLETSDKKKRASGPGKVKIPDTFQAQPSIENSQTPPRLTPETRRQSALVADVSQKLLQQLQNIANESVKSEQPLLHGVKVADKKDEFERRASLALIMPSPPTTSRTSQLESNNDYEPEKIDSLCESISLLDKLMQTIVEPVKKLEPLEVELLELIKQQQNLGQASSENQATPTSSERVQQLDREIKRKLSECAEKLDAKYKQKDKQQTYYEASPETNYYLNLDEVSKNDRSDSVETIKAESSNATPQIVHSSMVIDLGPKKVFREEKGERKDDICQRETTCVEEDSTASLNSQMVVGPAPIARSYKKVTFTKDGACITETGKIYSAKGDDGTMRRIERKSKITHYPNKVEGSSSSKKEEKCEEEEEYYYDGSGQEARPSWHRQEMCQASTHRSLVTGKPFEKLIMPSTGFLNDFDEEFERHPLFNNSSNATGDCESSRAQRSQTDSNSSCSSSSTDLLDDIFDTWTGAISMFNQNKRRGASGSSSIFDKHNVIFERAFAGDTILKQSPLFSPLHNKHHEHKRRSNRGGSTLSGAPRSESVEPQFQTRSIRHHRGDRRGDTSGYDSDYAPPERPASAMAGARDLFGSSNTFSRKQSPRFESLFDENFEQNFPRQNNDHSLLSNFTPFDPHMSLRQRLAQQHKQLWKGSTPSLFTDQDHEQERLQLRRQHQNLSHFLRPQEFSQSIDTKSNEKEGVRDRSSSGSQNQQSSGNWAKPPPGGGVNNRLNLEQSQSSNSFLQKSIALNANPTRKNTAKIMASSAGKNLPPSSSQHSIQKSVSKTSIIKSQLSNIKLGNGSTTKQQVAVSESASFIELKRSPSSQSGKQKQQSSFQQSRIVSSTASNASSSAAFWEGRVSPFNCEVGEELHTGQHRSREENLDSRVQSWLEESSGNISSSLSGSQSSASDITHKSDPFSNLYGTSRAKPKEQQQQLLKPSSIHSTKQSSVIVSSSSKQSISSDGNKQRVQKEEIIRRHKEAAFQENDKSNDGLVNMATKVTTATYSLRKADSPAIRANQSSIPKQQESKAFPSASKISTVSTTVETYGKGSFEDLNWIKTAESTQSSTSRLFGPQTTGVDEQANNEDSCESTDLESKSSSSLLDQLKSRGYRSMIDQRMVSSSSSSLQKQAMEQQASSSTVVQSSSRVIMSSSSSSGSRVIKESRQQISKFEGKSSSNVIESGDDSASKQQNVPGANSKTKEESKIEVKIEREVGVEQAKLDDQIDKVKEEDNLVMKMGEEAPSQDLKGENDDDDEDVREAKANIKPYLDSVKETDMFLKKMHEEEKDFERQRQQLFLFNNLMLHTKLNGIGGRINKIVPTTATSGLEFKLASSGNRSAPVGSSLGGLFRVSADSTLKDSQQKNVFIPIPSAALNFEPTYTINSTSYINNNRPYNSEASSYHPMSPLTALVRDPLEPVQPLNTTHHSDISPSRFSPNRRCRSQLSDQFNDYKRKRPVSANLDLLGSTSNAYFPSRSKRSVSQLRYQPIRKISQPIMSEYRSSFIDHSISAGGTNLSSSYDTNNHHGSDSFSTNLSETDADSDDGMSSYRASAYVPKIVPQGVQSHRQGRTLQRRSYRKDADLDLQSFSKLDREAKPESSYSQLSNRIERRTSLQPKQARCKTTISPTNSTSPSSSSHRRLSLNETSCDSNNDGNSRLSQLEQRIQENKRRRERLLQQSSSPVNERKRVNDESSPVKFRDHSLAAGASSSSNLQSTNSGLKGKPSRLESMEARIKRKSYCLRIGDCSPERTQLKSQMSLEKWRMTSTNIGISSTSRATTSSSPRNLLTNVTNNLFSALSNAASKGNQTPPLYSDAMESAQTTGVSDFEGN